jgi:hypothetical protein
MKKNLFNVTIGCLLVYLVVAIIPMLFDVKESEGSAELFFQLLGFLYLAVGFIYLAINLYCFYLVYKYAKGNRLAWFFVLLFFGIIIVPIITYRFSREISPFQQNEEGLSRRDSQCEITRSC